MNTDDAMEALRQSVKRLGIELDEAEIFEKILAEIQTAHAKS